jgi:predicted DNA-binding protein with PD1-like motif
MEKEGPFSLLCGQGLVSPSDEPNKMDIHYHATISGADDIVYGGHLERGTITLSTLDIFISEITGLEISRTTDPHTGVRTTSFKES